MTEYFYSAFHKHKGTMEYQSGIYSSDRPPCDDSFLATLRVHVASKMTVPCSSGQVVLMCITRLSA